MADAWAADRRRSDRRRAPLGYEVRIEGADTPVRVRELGPGGMVLASPRPRTAGEPLVFVLTTGTDCIGPMRGRVAHSRVLLARRLGEPPTCLVGVSFDQVTADQSARIARVLAEIDERHPRRSQDKP